MTGKNKIKLAALLVVAVVLLIVMFQNWKATPFRILFWERQLSPSLVLIVTFGLGFLGGLLAYGYLIRRKDRENAEQ